MSKLKDKLKVCISIGVVSVLVVSLGFAIHLNIKQHKIVSQLSVTADRLRLNIDILIADLEKRQAAEAEANKLEDQTAEDMNGL